MKRSQKNQEYFQPMCFFCEELIEIDQDLAGFTIIIGNSEQYVYAHKNHKENWEEKLQEYKNEA